MVKKRSKKQPASLNLGYYQLSVICQAIYPYLLHGQSLRPQIERNENRVFFSEWDLRPSRNGTKLKLKTVKLIIQNLHLICSLKLEKCII